MFIMKKIHLRPFGAPDSPPTQEEILASVWDDTPATSSMQEVEQSTKKFIMVIDDSTTVCKIVETCLRREHFLVLSFPDGITAIKWLRSSRGRMPGLIFLDVLLPKLDGFEVARWLRARPQYNAIPILMLTRRDGVLDRLKSRLVGTQGFLAKPFKIQDIVIAAITFLGVQSEEEIAVPFSSYSRTSQPTSYRSRGIYAALY